MGTVDGRTFEGRMMRKVRRELAEQLGGEDKLTPSQRLLIQRAAWLQLRCATLDARIVTGEFTSYDQASYAAFCNGLRRCLEALRQETPLDRKVRPSPQAKLDDYLKSKAT
jgi:hypothetical protein